MSRPARPIVDIDMADELDARLMLSVLAQVKAGDFSARMPLDWTGVAGKVADDLNEIIIANQAGSGSSASAPAVMAMIGTCRPVPSWRPAWTGISPSR